MSDEQDRARFAGLTDMELVAMQHELRNLPEDKETLNAILIELGKRQSERRERE